MSLLSASKRFERAIATERARLLGHPVYKALGTPGEVHLFLTHHVWAVWDFMSLLKALQARLTCVRVPWVPAPQPFAARLINEIVLGEETDEDDQGGHASHFELYLAAMAEAGADVGPIDRFVGLIAQGVHWSEALRQGGKDIPPAAADFVSFHLGLAEKGSTAALVGAFSLAREGVIPDMFNRLLTELARELPQRFGKFSYYLRRHVGLDGDEHGPAANKLLDLFTDGNETAVLEALEAARESLRLRGILYDSVYRALRSA